MRLGRRTEAVQETKLERRISSVRDPDTLRQYAEQAIYSVGRNLSEYDKTRSLDALETAAHDAEALNLLVRALYERLNA